MPIPSIQQLIANASQPVNSTSTFWKRRLFEYKSWWETVHQAVFIDTANQCKFIATLLVLYLIFTSGYGHLVYVDTSLHLIVTKTAFKVPDAVLLGLLPIMVGEKLLEIIKELTESLIVVIKTWNATRSQP